jgi:hypothetical protein
MIETKCPHCAKAIRAPDTQAGKRVRCPGCKEVLTLPATAAGIQAAPPAAPKPAPPARKRAVAEEEPILLVPATQESDDDAETRPRVRRRRDDDDDDDDDRPRRRRRRRDDDDDDDDDDRPRRSRIRRRGPYADCPNCDAPGHAHPVAWTFWGGLIGPRLFSHVCCNECGTCYNGRTGRSNNTAIAIYLIVTFVISAAIGFCVIFGAILGHR